MRSSLRQAHRRARVAAVAGVLALVALAGCAAVPTAEPAAGGYVPYAPPVELDGVTLKDDFAASPAETHDYWADPTLFEGADPIEYTSPDNGITVAGGDPATGAFVPPTTPSPASETGTDLGTISTAQVYDRTGLGGTAHGRLYMQFAGGNGVCSATVVNSANRSVVATAAHCLVDLETRAPAESVIFVPADRNNAKEQPLGKWAATQYFLPQQFMDNAFVDAAGAITGAGWSHDFAFLLMEEQDGTRIQDVAGGQGIAFGVPVTHLTQIGYPTAAPFDGTEEYVCASASWTSGAMADYRHACDMTPGCSGGGWLTYYDRNTGAGYLVAVLSTVAFDRSSTGGSVLGQTALTLYQQAEAG